MSDTWTVFQGIDGQFYFHRRSANGEIVASSEGYVQKMDAVAEARRQSDGVDPQEEDA